MGTTMTVGSLINIVRKKAQDENGDDFQDSELLTLYNLTLRTIVSLVPRAYTIPVSQKLTAGVVQAIPSEGMLLVDVTMNMGTDGETAGTPVTEADHQSLKLLCPGWNTLTATTEIEQYVRVPGLDTEYNCVPPSDGDGYVQLIYVATPPTTTYDTNGDWENEVIPLTDEHVTAIPDGILYHAYDDDTDTPGTEMRSNIYYQRMLQFLGVKEQHAGRRK